MQACTVCKGSKVRISPAFTSLEGREYPERINPCSACYGLGDFPEVNETEIRAAITATRGKNKGKIRAAMTSSGKDIAGDRAYYVWRLARFHAGVDMTLPMTADLMSRGDPYKKDLDRLSDLIAKESFGSNMRAARAWGQALGF